MTVLREPSSVDTPVAPILGQLTAGFERKELPVIHPEFNAYCSTDLSSSDPDFLYGIGQQLEEAGQEPVALDYFQKAEMLYAGCHKLSKRATCCLKLARLYHKREDFLTTLHYLQEAEALLPTVGDERLRTEFLFTFAEICPDVGRLRDSRTFALEALEGYKSLNNPTGQFKTLTLLAGVSRTLGDYQEVESRIEIAKHCHRAGNLDPRLYARTVNSELHLCWSKGNLSQALEHAHQLRNLADTYNVDTQKVFVRILFGNLYRAQGNYDVAQTWYDEAQKYIVKLKYDRFLPWFYAQTSWLKMLAGEFGQARSLIHKALESNDPGQVMSYRVFEAGLNILIGQLWDAEQSLMRSLEFYQKSGDEVATCNIRFYLGYICIREGRTEEASSYLEDAFRWLFEKNIDYLPLWWHPQMIGEVCVYAFIEKLYPTIAERMLVKHVGKPGISIVHKILLEHENAEARKRAGHILKSMGSEEFNEIEDVKDLQLKLLFEEFFHSGLLRREGFERLLNKLITAEKRRTHNPMLVAVFTLHVHGYVGTEIANNVQLTLSAVKNSIHAIYEIFQLPLEEFRSTRARRKRLQELAREEGFIL